MSIYKFITTIVLVLLVTACSREKLDLPVIPSGDNLFPSIDDAEYVLFNPILDAANGYSFSRPADVYVGVDNFLYVADTGNDRIVMLDLGGQVQGVSQFIAQPQSITQTDRLELLVVNKTNAVYKIDLFANNHQINSAPVEKVYEQSSEPNREFTAITVHNGGEYYVTVVDVADSSTNFQEFSFIYDFNSNHTLKGPIPLNVNGTGLYSTILPTGIVSLREQWLDVSSTNEVTPAFIFCHTGQTSLLNNNFKVQHVTTTIIEGSEVLIPNIGLLFTDLYDPQKFGNPQDVTIDRGGFVFVMDAGSSDGSIPPAFYRFALQSGRQIQGYVGDGTNGDRVVFDNPGGIAVLPFQEEQIVYVADTGNDRIMLFRLSTDL